VKIDYVLIGNSHTYAGAHAALSLLFPGKRPISLLDVGCGPGTWLRAAMDLGVQDAVGVDGLDLKPDQLFVPKKVIRVHDLGSPFDLGRTFDVALCLEVAEHLPAEATGVLIRSVTRHTNLVLFGAVAQGSGDNIILIVNGQPFGSHILTKRGLYATMLHGGKYRMTRE